MSTSTTDSDIVTMINVISVKPDNQQRLIDLMVATGESLRAELPGLISVSLHRSLDGARVVNYQQWESAEAFTAMQRDFADRMRGLLELAEPDPHLYEVVYTYSARAVDQQPASAGRGGVADIAAPTTDKPTEQPV
jgi:quinol monooxygenase YgiN